MTVSFTFFILAVVGFCAITCAVTIDVAYHKGCGKGFAAGYELGRKDADGWWMTANADTEKTRLLLERKLQ